MEQDAFRVSLVALLALQDAQAALDRAAAADEILPAADLDPGACVEEFARGLARPQPGAAGPGSIVHLAYELFTRQNRLVSNLGIQVAPSALNLSIVLALLCCVAVWVFLAFIPLGLGGIAAPVLFSLLIVATVFVQCRAFHRADGPVEMRPVGETQFVAGVAAMSESGIYGKTRLCEGIVGHADLRLGAAVDEVLARRAGEPRHG